MTRASDAGARLAWRERSLLDPAMLAGEMVLLGELNGVGHFALTLDHPHTNGRGARANKPIRAASRAH